MGRTFEVTPESADCFNTFNPDHPAANDRSPWGMVEEMKTFCELTKDKHHLVDVGALFGIYSLVFTDSPDKTAIALEPSPLAFPILQDNIKLNPDRNILPLPCFAGESGKGVDCGLEWKHMVAGKPSNEFPNIASIALDDIPEIKEVDVIKIDVEGYELKVLRGATKLLSLFKPMIFLELHYLEVPLHGDSLEDLYQFLRSFGYRIEYYDGESVPEFALGEPNRVLCT